MMNQQDKIRFLEHVPLFSKLSAGQLQKVARSVVEREYETGDEILPQGKEGIGLFIVVSGGAQAVRERDDGTQIVVNTFGWGDFFGELSLLDGEARTASVFATAQTECLVLVRWEFLSTLKADPDMVPVIMREMSRRFRKALDTLAY